MRLLVSVRSAAETVEALAGGADVIDAKEPSRGSLGPVTPESLRAIALAVSGSVPLSVALGDPTDAAAAAAAIAPLGELESRAGGTFAKVGLAGARSHAAAESLIGGAMDAAARCATRPGVVVVAYADQGMAGAPHRDLVSTLAAAAGASGVLLDTYLKDGRDLFDHVAEPELRAWIARAKQAGLVVALAGSLSAAGIARAAGLPADIVGVRGAACAGGRAGRISAARVRALRGALRQGRQSASVVA